MFLLPVREFSCKVLTENDAKQFQTVTDSHARTLCVYSMLVLMCMTIRDGSNTSVVNNIETILP